VKIIHLRFLFRFKEGDYLAGMEVRESVPIVSLAYGAEIRKTTRKAIELLGGIEKFVQKGDKVFIKPNLMSPTQHSITSGDILFTIVEMCKEAGARDDPKAEYPDLEAAGLT